MATHWIIFIGTATLFSSLLYYSYIKVFGEKQYKILKDYKYKHSRIQLIVNPQHNLCGNCYDMIDENEEIGRFPNCDHHFCHNCIHKLVDESHSDLKYPCKMCLN